MTPSSAHTWPWVCFPPDNASQRLAFCFNSTSITCHIYTTHHFFSPKSSLSLPAAILVKLQRLMSSHHCCHCFQTSLDFWMWVATEIPTDFFLFSKVNLCRSGLFLKSLLKDYFCEYFCIISKSQDCEQSLNLKKMLNHHFLESCTIQTQVRPSEDMPSELVGTQIHHPLP